MLPEAFLERMKSLLGDEYDAFLATFDKPNVRGARINTLKIDPEDYVKAGRLELSPIPYADDCYQLTGDDIAVGKLPEHHGGVIYMQDPGAMAALSAVEINEGDYVLDLCSAPGGKSGQAAAKIGDSGFILSNEFVPKRAKITVGNIERLGIRNAIVTSLDTREFKKMFDSFFDIVIADVPCSGEGMFRKNEEAINEWSTEAVLNCAERGRGILENAATLVKDGGHIVYSTCTYSVEENEGTVYEFLNNHSDYELVKPREELISSTRGGISVGGMDMTNARRFYPHVSDGEGQFVAVLRRSCGAPKNTVLYKGQEKPLTKDEEKLIRAFLDENLENAPKVSPKRVGENVVLISHGVAIPPFSVFSAGVLLGEVKKGLILPSHQFFSAYGRFFKRKIELSENEELLKKYLDGEEIDALGCQNGYAVVTFMGAAIGGVKVSAGRAKNHYPKGLRNK